MKLLVWGVVLSSILLGLQLGCSSTCGSGVLEQIKRGFKGQGTGCVDGVVTKDASISVTLPTSDREIWVDDEIAKRTLSFTHTGDSVQCSTDGGTTFSDCTSSTSLVWNVADYAKEHVIKSTSNTGKSASYSITPSTQYPGVSFVSCDSEETGTNGEFDQFTTAHLGVANKVICVSNGVTISNSASILDNDLVFSADNITLIAREGHTATFDGGRGTGAANVQSNFTATGRSGLRLVGLKITNNTGAGSWFFRADSSSEDIQIQDCILENTSPTGAFYGIYVTGNSGNTTPIVLKRTSVSVDDGKMGAFVSSGTLSISSSTITSKNIGARVSISSTLNITNSTVECADTDTSDYPLYNFRGTLSLESSTIKDGCGNGAVIVDDNNASAATVNIEGSILMRTTNATGNTSAALVALNGGVSNSFNSSNSQNRICNESGSTEDFTAVSTGTFSGTWVDGSQLNGGVLADCP